MVVRRLCTNRRNATLRFNLDLRQLRLQGQVPDQDPERRRTRSESESWRRQIDRKSVKRDRTHNLPYRPSTRSPISNRSRFLRHLSPTCQKYSRTRTGTQTQRLQYSSIRSLHATFPSPNTCTLPLHDTSMRLQCHHLPLCVSVQQAATVPLKGTPRIYVVLPAYTTHSVLFLLLSGFTHLLPLTRLTEEHIRNVKHQ